MSDDDRKPSICFVAPKAYACLSGRGDVAHIGGAEAQQVRIARALSRRGHAVSFVTLDHGQADGEAIDGIRVFKAYRGEAGAPGLRFFHPRVTGVWRAMGRAGADVYYQRTSDTLTGVVAAFCRSRRKRFVYAVGHDGDCVPELPFCKSLRERIPYQWGLRRADVVVAQTDAQRAMLARHFGVSSVVIRSCVAEPGVSNNVLEPGDGPRVVWIGRFAPEKRLGFMLDVAQKCQSVAFDVLGEGPGSEVEALKRLAESLPNVTLRGYVPHGKVGAYYERAAALVNTSESEGFPNTFLEAWSRRIPVVTTCDPDGVTAEHGLGVVGESVEEMARAVAQVCENDDLRKRLGEAGFAYFKANHTVEAASEAYGKLLEGLVGCGQRVTAAAGKPKFAS